MSKAIAKMFEPMFAAFAKRYQGWVGAELSKYGLRYDDLLDETMNLDVAEALKRLPQEERDLRMQRLKRAMDLSLKHVYLDPEMQKKQTPFKWYIKPVLEEVSGGTEGSPGDWAAVQPPDSESVSPAVVDAVGGPS